MGSHPGGGDDHLEPFIGGGSGESLDLGGRAVGGHDVQLVLDAEVGEGLEAGLQYGDVGPGASQDSYAGHGLIVGASERTVKGGPLLHPCLLRGGGDIAAVVAE